MSLELSRRSFMKLSALTAVAVAGSSLLGGCSDSNSTLYPSGAFGKTLKLMGEMTASNPAYANNTFTCDFTAKCTSANPLAVYGNNFQIVVIGTDSKKTTRKYNPKDFGVEFSLSKNDYALKKGEEMSSVLTATGITINDGETVQLMYFPRQQPTSSNTNGYNYTDLCTTWKATYKNGAFA